MGKIDRVLLEEAFILPIRFALLLDDKFPVYSSLAQGDVDPKLDNIRAKELFDICRGKGWLCDVANRIATAERFEEEKHLHQSDLLILDFNLDPAEENDPTSALTLLQRLSASDHFNLVVVYTNTPAKEATRDIVFSLGGGADISGDAVKAVETILEDLLEEDSKNINDALSEQLLNDYLNGKRLGGSANDVRERLRDLKIKPDLYADTISYLTRRKMRTRLKPLVMERRKPGSPISSSVGQDGVQWAAYGNLFVAVVNKYDDQPAVLLDRLMEALEAWDPSPLHVMLMHARSALEKAGTLVDHEVLATPRQRAGWFLRILLGKNEREQQASINELYIRLFERLARRVEPSMVDFGFRLINPEMGGDAVLLAKDLARAEPAATVNDVYHALNEFVSSEPCPDGPMTTGVLFKQRIGTVDQYWICISPACDLIPGQNVSGWDGELRPILPVSIARLKPFKNLNALNTALVHAETGRYLYLFVDGSPIALQVADDASRHLELEMALFENDGVIVDGKFKGHLIKLGEDRRLTFASSEFEAVAKLRPDYANRLLTQSGQQRSRIGVDFFRLPELKDAPAELKDAAAS